RDVERYLKDEPVEARPPSTTYRLQKFLRRNRAAVLTTAIVTAAIVLGLAISVWQAMRAQDAEATLLADQEKHDQELRKKTDELIAERRQHALDRAIEAAFGGDLEKARKTILEAQRAGVEAHQVY